MSEADLRQSLEALRAEIDRLPAEEADAKARMERLVADLDRQLDGPEEERSTNIAETLPALVEQFEVEHPRLTRTLNEIMITLSNMGI